MHLIMRRLTLAGCLLVVVRGATTPLATGDALSGLWPRRAGVASGTTPLALSKSFAFEDGSTHGGAPASPRLARAFERYERLILGQKTLWPRAPAPTKTLPLQRVVVMVEAAGDGPPRYGDDESFELVIARDEGTLAARTFAGAARGLETFAQTTINVGGTVLVRAATGCFTVTSTRVVRDAW